ncbi:hypothetical protein BKA70DRAFT_1313575 [Coprinopsis sp. MPI-PUGE-AT-0042]|nr:hypothetical protein BKA70DRAFT_1313575 [Coprinopsis sp. MPI-PUGE-AT-0042]
MSALEITGFRLAPDDDYPLHITAKRYRPAFDDRREENEHQDDVLTLVVLHSTSFHKETWEPCLETMFRLAGARGKQFREAWAIESPNHGETAPWNTVAFTTSSYATQCVSRFLTKGPVSLPKRAGWHRLLLHDLDTPTLANQEDARRHLAEIQARRRKGKGKWDDRVLDKFAVCFICPCCR